MTLSVADRVLETSTTTGTGTLNLAGAVTGFRSFITAVGTGKKVPYIMDDNTNWEVGIGTVTSGSPSTLSRTTVLASSNSNALVNWGAGTRNIRLAPLSNVVATRDENLNLMDGYGATVSGSGTAQVITFDAAPKAYSDGMFIAWFCSVNITGVLTVNVNSLGAKTVKYRSADLSNGAFTAGDLIIGHYKAATGFVELVTPPRNVFASLAQGAKADTAIQASSLCSLFAGKTLSGLVLSNNVSDAVNDIDVAAGSCVSDDGTTIMTLSAITKQLDAAWAVGNSLGGRDTGVIADGTWHIWVINRPDTNVTDVLFSLSATAPTLPANYTKKKRIGCVIRSGATILAFTQVGSRFILAAGISTAGGNVTSYTNLVLAGCPTGIAVNAIINVTANALQAAGGNSTLFIKSLSTSEETIYGSGGTNINSVVINIYQKSSVDTNSSGQISYKSSASNSFNTVAFVLLGWTDHQI